jgi:hypothetical protein
MEQRVVTMKMAAQTMFQAGNFLLFLLQKEAMAMPRMLLVVQGRGLVVVRAAGARHSLHLQRVRMQL